VSRHSIPTVVLAAIKHLIAGESWAQKIIEKHVGKVISLQLPIGEFALLIVTDGFSNASLEEPVTPNVSLNVASQAVMEFISGGKSAAAKHVRIAGDVDLAHDLSTLASNLRWEAEEDLAKWIGDAPAHRVGIEAKKAFEAGKRASKDLRGGIRDYFVHEKKAVVDINEFEVFKNEVRQLRDALDRSEKRIERILKSLNQEKSSSGA
jgi:ubiquinone biosynthesis protein UbiJ